MVFNSLYEIHRLEEVKVFYNKTFQFSLWDSWSFRRKQNFFTQTTFNSLYEILSLLFRLQTIFLISFNSLYEIPPRITYANEYLYGVAFNSLYEILQLKNTLFFLLILLTFNSLYEILEKAFIKANEFAVRLSILFMRFPLIEVFLRKGRLDAVFQFSLWDSVYNNGIEAILVDFQFSLWDSQQIQLTKRI